VKEPEPFCRKLDADIADPGDVAAWPVEAINEASFHRIDGWFADEAPADDSLT
jgi:hypothetical protein